MPLGPEAEAKLRDQLKSTFDKFDADGSGEVSSDELAAMLQSMGMLVQPSILKQMMDEADADKSGEIDFEEFFKVMKAQAEGGSGGAFAALVSREKNAGPARKWVSDRLGAGVKIGDDPRIVTKEGKGWGAVILEGVFRDTSKSSREAKEDNNDYDAADFLLQATAISGPVCIGVASNNFDPTVDVQTFESGGSSGNTVVLDGASGKVYNKKLDLAPSTVMGPIATGDAFQLSLNMNKSSADFTVLGPPQGEKGREIKYSASVDVKFPAATLVIGFGEVPEGSPPTELCVCGQSCERSMVVEMDVNETESAEKQAARSNPAAAAAMALA